MHVLALISSRGFTRVLVVEVEMMVLVVMVVMVLVVVMVLDSKNQ